jgi:hypothetical protein
MVLTLADLEVIAIAEPQGVDRLGFVVHAEPSTQRAEMTPHCPHAQAHASRSDLMGATLNVCA